MIFLLICKIFYFICEKLNGQRKRKYEKMEQSMNILNASITVES